VGRSLPAPLARCFGGSLKMGMFSLGNAVECVGAAAVTCGFATESGSGSEVLVCAGGRAAVSQFHCYR